MGPVGDELLWRTAVAALVADDRPLPDAGHRQTAVRPPPMLAHVTPTAADCRAAGIADAAGLNSTDGPVVDPMRPPEMLGKASRPGCPIVALFTVVGVACGCHGGLAALVAAGVLLDDPSQEPLSGETVAVPVQVVGPEAVPQSGQQWRVATFVADSELNRWKPRRYRRPDVPSPNMIHQTSGVAAADRVTASVAGVRCLCRR